MKAVLCLARAEIPTGRKVISACLGGARTGRDSLEIRDDYLELLGEEEKRKQKKNGKEKKEGR